MYRSSPSSEASVAYAAPGDFAGEKYFFFTCHEKNIFGFRRLMEAVEAGRANFVDVTTVKV